MIQEGTHLGVQVVVDLILGAGATAEVLVEAEAGGLTLFFFILEIIINKIAKT